MWERPTGTDRAEPRQDEWEPAGFLPALGPRRGAKADRIVDATRCKQLREKKSRVIRVSVACGANQMPDMRVGCWSHRKTRLKRALEVSRVWQKDSNLQIQEAEEHFLRIKLLTE